MVNGRSSSFFRLSDGLRQGDPLSPLLFIMVLETLSKLLEKVKEVGLLHGVQIGRDNNQIEIRTHSLQMTP